jgi:hypothetical protein
VTISKPALSKVEGTVAALTVVLAIAGWWVLPHADFPDYGKFADDQRSTFRNVASNGAFLLVGGAGVVWSMRHRRVLGEDYAAALALFGGVIATGFGSAYFHADPLVGDRLNRFTLLWDRLPMTIAFAGLLALVLRDRVFQHRIVLPLLAIVGIATTLYWYWSHDLYPYAFFQFYTAVGTLLIVMVVRPVFTEAGYVVAAVVLFGVSKVFEDFDHAVFAKWGIGGHPLKHLVSALAALMILLWLEKRRVRA